MIKRMTLLPLLAGALLVSACAAVAPIAASAAGLPPTPQAAANTTVLDEQAATGVELAYKAMRLAIETAVDAGFLKGANASKAAALDNKAYAALKVARDAYRVGNAPGYFAALAQARTAITDALAVMQAH
jgi:hypothetical protein